MKQVGLVTGNQFGHLYIDGVPFNVVKVKRFMGKGAGIKLQDTVIFETDAGTNVLSYLKNALYMDGSEIRMVKEYRRTVELNKANIGNITDEIGDEIRRELAEESTNGEIPMEEHFTDLPVPEIPENVLQLLTPDNKRTISIMLQSCMHRATDLAIVNAKEGEPVDTVAVKRDTLDLMFWIDKNSTQIFTSEYMKKVMK